MGAFLFSHAAALYAPCRIVAQTFVLDEAKDRQPLPQGELRRGARAREADIARKPLYLPRREVASQPVRDVGRAVSKAVLDERTIDVCARAREYRRLASPHLQQRARDARHGHEVASRNDAIDGDLEPRLVQERELRLARNTCKLLRRLPLDDEAGDIGWPRGVQQLAQNGGCDAVRHISGNAVRRLRQCIIEEVRVYTFD